MRFTIQQGCRQGQRPYQQDRLAYCYVGDAALLVVADGMGGHAQGELAAELAVTLLIEAFQQQVQAGLGHPAAFLEAQIQQAHAAITELALTPDSTPRTTIVAAIIQAQQLYCAHVGDSRLYHYRDGHLLFRTEDHSLVQKWLRQGRLDTHAASQHPDRHKIYNCLGSGQLPDVAHHHHPELQPGDTLLLCSDGLWASLSENNIGDILHDNSLEKGLTTLLDMAELLGAEQGDNISALALRWQDSTHAQDLAQMVSTAALPRGRGVSLFEPPLASPGERTLEDDRIELAIAEIQVALQRTQRS